MQLHYFYGSFCSICNDVKPEVIKLKDKYNLEFIEHDVEEETFDLMEINYVPTLVLTDNSKILFKGVSFPGIAELKEYLTNNQSD